MAESRAGAGSKMASTGADRVGDKMTSKQREILRTQRSLLSRNIIWNSALAARLKERRLLTDAMIAQIDATQGRENQICVLLDLIPLRSSQVYDKLVDALHLSGHALLADFLRDEDVSKQPLNVEDLFARLPFLDQNLKDPERNAIEDYMLEKIQSCVLAHVWHWNTKDKDKALESKMEHASDSFRFQQEMKQKDKQVQEAERVAREAREETLALKAELRAMADTANRQQQQIKGQLDTQVRFSVANDNIAQRLSQRLKVAEQTLKTIQETLQATIKLAPHERERDLMKLADNAFHFLPEDLELFTSQFKKLQHLQTKYEKLVDECNGIIVELGHPKSNDPGAVGVLKVFQDYANRKEDQVQKLQREVTRQEQLVEDVTKAKREEERKLATAGTVWQNAILSVMRKQLQDLKTAIRKKETTVTIKEEELSKLRGKVSDLEQSLSVRTKEANQAMRALKLVELESATTDVPKAQAFPSIGAAGATTTAAGGGGGGGGAGGIHTPSRPTRTTHRSHNIAMPGGVVVEADTPLEMYPAGLSTKPLMRQDTTEFRQGVPSDYKSRTLMKSSLGDFRSLHVNTKMPASRGGGGGGALGSPANQSMPFLSRGGGGAGSELTNHGMPPSSRGGNGGTGLDNSGFLNKNSKRKYKV